MGEVRIAKYAVGLRRLAVDQVGLDRIGIRRKYLRSVDPVVVDALADAESLFRQLRRRLQAASLKVMVPARLSNTSHASTAPGNGGRVDAMLRHLLLEAAMPRGARGVAPEGARPLPLNAISFFSFASQAMTNTSPPIPALPGSTTFNTAAVATAASNALPPFFQDLQARLRRQRLAGGDHAVARQHFGARLRQPAAGAIAAGRGKFGGESAAFYHCQGQEHQKSSARLEATRRRVRRHVVISSFAVRSRRAFCVKLGAAPQVEREQRDLAPVRMA